MIVKLASVLKYHQSMTYHNNHISSCKQIGVLCQCAYNSEQSTPTLERLIDLLAVHKRYGDKAIEAKVELNTLEKFRRWGPSSLKAWKDQFDVMADLWGKVAELEKEIMEDDKIKAFVARQ